MRRFVICFGFLAAALPGRSEAEGEVNWFSLLTEDVTAATRFYSELFGWSIQPSPTGAHMAVRNGIPIAGFSQIEDRMPGDSESLWLAAISVTDVARSVAAASRLGATVHEDVTRLEGWGTYALIQDPQGAPALLVRTERPLGGTEGYGGWAWAELWSQDVQGSRDFYTQVIGYEVEDVEIGEQTYTVFGDRGDRRTGLMSLENPAVASRWAPYVGVADLRRTLVRVWGAGGEVLLEPAEVESEIGGEDRIALIADPTGAALFLYQVEEEAQVDPSTANEPVSSFSADRERRRAENSSGPSVSVHVSYGFGGGWGSAWPGYPYGPYGPPVFRY